MVGEGDEREALPGEEESVEAVGEADVGELVDKTELDDGVGLAKPMEPRNLLSIAMRHKRQINTSNSLS